MYPSNTLSILCNISGKDLNSIIFYNKFILWHTSNFKIAIMQCLHHNNRTWLYSQYWNNRIISLGLLTMTSHWVVLYVLKSMFPTMYFYFLRSCLQFTSWSHLLHFTSWQHFVIKLHSPCYYSWNAQEMLIWILGCRNTADLTGTGMWGRRCFLFWNTWFYLLLLSWVWVSYLVSLWYWSCWLSFFKSNLHFIVESLNSLR